MASIVGWAWGSGALAADSPTAVLPPRRAAALEQPPTRPSHPAPLNPGPAPRPASAASPLHGSVIAAAGAPNGDGRARSSGGAGVAGGSAGGSKYSRLEEARGEHS